MKTRLLLDTDVFVDYLRAHPSAVAYVDTEADRKTLNTKHYPMLKDLKTPYVKSR